VNRGGAARDCGGTPAAGQSPFFTFRTAAVSARTWPRYAQAPSTHSGGGAGAIRGIGRHVGCGGEPVACLPDTSQGSVWLGLRFRHDVVLRDPAHFYRSFGSGRLSGGAVQHRRGRATHARGAGGGGG